MKIVDMHCDTLDRLLTLQESGTPENLRQNKGHVDLLRMKDSGYLLQNFAMFVQLDGKIDPWERMCGLYQCYERELERNQDILAPVLAFSDIEKNRAAGKLSAMLTVEEGAVCKGEIKKLHKLYGMGVRMMTLTWNFENELGYPNLLPELKEAMTRAVGEWTRAVKEQRAVTEKDSVVKEQERAEGETGAVCVERFEVETVVQEKYAAAQDAFNAYFHTPSRINGLTEKGREFVTEMERIGMIPDVSHLSDAGFYDVLAVTRRPFVASHSNARTVSPAVRNMTDDMIRKLAQRGGVMGLNFCPDFLEETPFGEPNPGTIAAVVRHARHIVNVGGIDVLGLGSDFDGIPTHSELSGAECMGALWETMREGGFTERELDKIFSENVLRVYREWL